MLARGSFLFNVVLLGCLFFIVLILCFRIISVLICWIVVFGLLVLGIYFGGFYLLFPLFFICFCHFDFISFMPFEFALKVCRNLSLKFILVKIMEFDCFIFLFNLLKFINYFEYFYLALHFVKMNHPS